MAVSAPVRPRTVALAGNPNTGKTTLFNALTGLRQRVANYPGVTVEKKEGRLVLDDGSHVALLDLPGTYSLSAHSPDEEVARDVILGRRADTPRPDLVVCVVDASNLERNLNLVLQIADAALPVVVVLNMLDVAERRDTNVDPEALARELGMPVIPAVATEGRGVPQLRQLLSGPLPGPVPRRWRMAPAAERAFAEVAERLEREAGVPPETSFAVAVELLINEASHLEAATFDPTPMKETFAKRGIDVALAPVGARYAWIAEVVKRAGSRPASKEDRVTQRLDAVLTHRLWGSLVFFALMALMFQALMSWSNVPMSMIEDGFGVLGRWVTDRMPAGDLRSLIVDGVIGGVGGILVFLPQIVLLFFAIGLMEDSGYMARAAFMMDRVMSRAGLHGRSFIPLLSSTACAVPGVMAARTIENRKDRLVTILVAPLMSCSARLPVYAVMLAAFVPDKRVWGPFTIHGLTLPALYFLGFAAALGMAFLFKRTLLRGETPTLIMELPPYRLPGLKTTALFTWLQAREFLVRAGTVILAMSILIWFIASYPKSADPDPGVRLRHSFAGRAGHLLEPLIAPLGFDWKVGIGLIGATAAREVFVSTMGTVYSVAEDDEASAERSLREKLRTDVDPRTGAKRWTPLRAVCLMVYFVLAMQCLSTTAVVKRETGGWGWPLFQFAYMTALAWIVTFGVRQVGLLMGWGGG